MTLESGNLCNFIGSAEICDPERREAPLGNRFLNMSLTSIGIFLVAAVAFAQAGMVSVCSDVKDCAACTQSYVSIFAFREHCRWCVDTQRCGGPLACPTTSATSKRDPFTCPAKAPTAKGKRYTDKLGRSLYALCMSVKTNSPETCLSSVRPDVKVHKYYEVPCDASKNTCAGMLAVSEEAKAIYVIYRGSSMDKQLFTEFIHGIGAQLGAWEKFVGGGGVMTYFYGAFQALFINGGMKSDLMKLKEEHKEYRVWVTGHSLGGSLASMTSLYLVNQTLFTPDKVKLVTFGEPRTGNYNYARAVEQSVVFRYRVVHRNDFVTNIPTSVDPDGLLMAPAAIERQAYFYRHAVIYDNDMKKGDTFKVCEMAEDKGCRNVAMAIDMNDHVTYFGLKAEDYIKDKCRKEDLLT
uniref:Lipase_3 domain-containing protein n=1 Tax=Steinernema glaseri TaxID=37863 RepID=A0A1I8A7B7_9BILA